MSTPKKTEIQLGMEVKDLVSGFVGIVTAKTQYLNGCVRFTVEPKAQKDGTVPASLWFDEQQLVVLKPTTPLTKIAQVATATGGDRPAARRAADPRRPSMPRR